MNSKQDSFLEKAYADKDRDYYEARRPEMLALIPTTARRILDVGCGAGGFGVVLKRERGVEVWGIEPEAAAATAAAKQLDRVFEGLFTEESGLPAKHFDCIVFNDVLEHMLDPGRALAYAKTLLRDGGTIVASIPNIGHFPTVWRLAIRGEWEYTERGILDKTHLRFFTRSSIRAMFESAGYRLNSLEGVNDYCQLLPSDRPLWRYYKLLSLIPARGIHDMRYLQFGVQASVAQA